LASTGQLIVEARIGQARRRLMATRQMNAIIQHLRRAALLQDMVGSTDGQLLESFSARRDEAAFAALVRRHGPMVLGVCCRILCNHHDAEDAFQATFLILARKASSVRPRDRVANWLHGVAYRTALKARTVRAKRTRREKQVTPMPEPEAVQQDHWHDLQPLLDQELSRLPETYRLPVLLCDLEGKSIKEATRQLGWPQGTLAGRLVRARKLLAKRLAGRGVVLSAGSLAMVLAEKAASACVPPALAVATVKGALVMATGQTAAAGVISAKVAVLVEGVLKSMMLTKLKTMTAGLLVLATFASGGGLLTHQLAVGQQVKAGEKGEITVKHYADGTVVKSDAFNGVNSDAGLKGGIILNERNFDIVRPPTSFDDLLSGRAGRGAGQEFRLEAVPGTEVQRHSAALQEVKSGQKDDPLDRPAEPAKPFDKCCYVSIHRNGADEVVVVPIVANRPPTVLDAIAYSEQFTAKIGEMDAWLARLGPEGKPQGLQIDWAGISQRGETKTNYPLQAGDRLFLQDKSRLHGEWFGRDNDNGKFSLIFGPNDSIRRITESGHDARGTYSVDWSKKPHHLDVKWGKLPTSQTIMEFIQDGQLRIECGGGTTRPSAFTDELMVLARKEQPAGTRQAEADALKDLGRAHVYRRSGHFASAHYYYELVRCRYPGTTFAIKATEGLAELNRHRITLADGSEGWEPTAPQQPQPAPKVDRTPIYDSAYDSAADQEITKLREQVKTLERRLAALEEEKTEANGKKEPRIARVGQIVVVGNTKTPTAVILKKMQVFPGQVLDTKALQKAEECLAALQAVIIVTESNHGSGYRDVLVTVKEE
jgi:RNA polymerase sigma factor (sigma-70 family)